MMIFWKALLFIKYIILQINLNITKQHTLNYKFPTEAYKKNQQSIKTATKITYIKT